MKFVLNRCKAQLVGRRAVSLVFAVHNRGDVHVQNLQVQQLTGDQLRKFIEIFASLNENVFALVKVARRYDRDDLVEKTDERIFGEDDQRLLKVAAPSCSVFDLTKVNEAIEKVRVDLFGRERCFSFCNTQFYFVGIQISLPESYRIVFE